VSLLFWYSLGKYKGDNDMKPKFTTAELYQLYQDGLSINGVAKKTGLSFALVQNRFAKAGLKTRNHSEAQKLAYIKQRRKPAGAVTISGPDHWCWKGGKAKRPYRNKIKKEECNTCGSRQNLCIHHVDFDHYNDNPENLKILCVSCHLSYHKQVYWDAKKNGEAHKSSNGPVGWTRRDGQPADRF